jgi:L-ribulose-5-phosphate 3-epimerase UlaE
MPKGEVRKNDVVFDYAVKELRESRLRKPVDVEVWDAKMEEARTKIEEAHKNAQIRLGEVRQQIKEIKDKE